MYGLARDLKIAGLVGSDLQQICIGKFDIQFLFRSETSIAVQGAIRILKGSEVIANWTDAVWDSVSFQQLLNLNVLSYQVPNENVLAISFEDGFTLELIDDSEQYESMQIYPKGELGIVI